MSRGETIRFLILRTIGNFLLLFAIFGVIATFGPSIYYEVNFFIAKTRGVRYVIAGDTNPPAGGQKENESSPLGEIVKKEQAARLVSEEGGGFASVLSGPKEQILIPKDTDFSILIPRIGASAKVFANVDSSNEKEFLPILQQGVAHAKGTVFPGIKGNTYLFAHSTDNFWNAGRYNAVFYLLKNLQIGDDIVIFFENRRYNYKVVESKILDSDEISPLVKAQEVDREQLVLQTCWPPGTTWKRLIVIAQPK